MKMEINVLRVLLVLVLSHGCISSNKPYVEIKSEVDTIGVGETYTAIVTLKNIEKNVYPEFFVVINDSDTFYLPPETHNKSASYSIESRYPGDKQWTGYVKYLNNDEVVVLEYTDKYVVE